MSEAEDLDTWDMVGAELSALESLVTGPSVSVFLVIDFSVLVLRLGMAHHSMIPDFVIRELGLDITRPFTVTAMTVPQTTGISHSRTYTSKVTTPNPAKDTVPR